MAKLPTPLAMSSKQLSLSPLPPLAIRLLRRTSSTRTQPVAPRTFQALEPWPRFLEDARSLSDALDDTVLDSINPMAFYEQIEEPFDEADIRSALNSLFMHVNKLARKSELAFRYLSGGSGPAFSCTDMVILDRSQPQPALGRESLSSRVFGCGEAKGSWQWKLDGSTLEEALNDPKTTKAFVEVLQQLFGDMIMDEVQVGFISNYTETVFVRRLDGKSKGLQYSPVVKIDDAPLEKFLFVLEYAEKHKKYKPLFSRTLVKETPLSTSSGRTTKRRLIEITERKRKRAKTASLWRDSPSADQSDPIYEESEFQSIPVYEMDELGISGLVHGLAKYGNVIAGKVDGRNLVLKLFDLRFREAAPAFVREQKAYHHLQGLQGECIPSLLLVGRLAHTNLLFLGLTDAGSKLKKIRKNSEKKVLSALDRIHEAGVLHGDLKLSHVLWKKSKPVFIDFDKSMVEANTDELSDETREMEHLLLSEEE